MVEFVCWGFNYRVNEDGSIDTFMHFGPNPYWSPMHTSIHQLYIRSDSDASYFIDMYEQAKAQQNKPHPAEIY
jgi:hypothetical protein